MPKTKLGAFWKKVLQDGRTVYSGHVIIGGTKTPMNLWQNDDKKNPKGPDLTAVLNDYIASPPITEKK